MGELKALVKTPKALLARLRGHAPEPQALRHAVEEIASEAGAVLDEETIGLLQTRIGVELDAAISSPARSG